MDKILKIRFILGLACGLTIVAGKLAAGRSTNPDAASFAEPHVWIAPGLEKIEAQIDAIIRKNVRLLFQSVLIRTYAPPSWAIMVTDKPGHWSARTTPSLRDPDGRPAVLINVDALLADRRGAVLGHEMFHLAHYQKRAHEEWWVQEGVALLAEYLVTEALNPVVRVAQAIPETSLVRTTMPNPKTESERHARDAQMGHAFLYFYYVYRHCGADDFLTDMLTNPSPRKGTAFLNERLAHHATRADICRDFVTSFRAFQRARFLNDPRSPADHVLLGEQQPAIRDLPADLSAYAAGAYARPRQPDDRPDRCFGQDRALSERMCLRIQMESKR